MSLVEQLHNERKARLARISSRAYVPARTEVEIAPPAPVLSQVDDAFFQEAWDVLDPKPPLPDIIGIMRRIQLAVCDEYKVSLQDLLSARRAAHVVEARQVSMYLIKEVTLRSLPEIGRKFGGRDHTTVLHSVRKIAARVESDESFAVNVARIKSQFAKEEDGI